MAKTRFGFHPELFSNPVSQATVKTGLQDFVLLDAFILILLVEQEFFCVAVNCFAFLSFTY